VAGVRGGRRDGGPDPAERLHRGPSRLQAALLLLYPQEAHLGPPLALRLLAPPAQQVHARAAYLVLHLAALPDHDHERHVVQVGRREGGTAVVQRRLAQAGTVLFHAATG